MTKAITGPQTLRRRGGAWCQNCGVSVKRLSQAELRVLATIFVLEAERADSSPLLQKGARSPDLEERCGLNHSAAVSIANRLAALGYTVKRKGYRRNYNLYSLSPATRADPALCGEIAAALEGVRPARTRITPGALGTAQGAPASKETHGDGC